MHVVVEVLYFQVCIPWLMLDTLNLFTFCGKETGKVQNINKVKDIGKYFYFLPPKLHNLEKTTLGSISKQNL